MYEVMVPTLSPGWREAQSKGWHPAWKSDSIGTHNLGIVKINLENPCIIDIDTYYIAIFSIAVDYLQLKPQECKIGCKYAYFQQDNLGSTGLFELYGINCI